MPATRDDPASPPTRLAQTARVAIAEDSLLVREGLGRILRDSGFDVVGAAAKVEELLELVERARPDVGSSTSAYRPTTATRACAPPPRFARAGYLLKDRILDGSQLTHAIERVVAGGVVVDPSLVAQLLDRRRRADPLDELTPREREVLGLMAEGLTDRGIAQRLYVGPKTVETHVRHIFQKLSLPESALENKRVRAVLTYLRA